MEGRRLRAARLLAASALGRDCLPQRTDVSSFPRMGAPAWSTTAAQTVVSCRATEIIGLRGKGRLKRAELATSAADRVVNAHAARRGPRRRDGSCSTILIKARSRIERARRIATSPGVASSTFVARQRAKSSKPMP